MFSNFTLVVKDSGTRAGEAYETASLEEGMGDLEAALPAGGGLEEATV